MRRVTKKLSILVFGVFLTGFYCEFLIYYVVIDQCSWPALRVGNTMEPIRAFILADPHLLGPRKSHWFDRWRREWQMHRAFQTILSLHRPDAIFILGDLFDEGELCNDKQFQVYVDRYHSLFSAPTPVEVFIMPGNHDIGFHNYMKKGSFQRFNSAMNTSSVELVTLKGSHLVLINSMAMQGDSCNMCKEARRKIEDISKKLLCPQESRTCPDISKANYSRPILMQHFPLYRQSDDICKEPDPSLKRRPNKENINTLSKKSTEFLIDMIKPRLVFGGHTHRGCLVHHLRSSEDNTVEFDEYSVPSFSWRNRPDPKFMLVTITPTEYAVHECGLPLETTIAFTALFLLFVLSYCLFKWRTLGR